MEFDRNRIYTAVNAEKLKICIGPVWHTLQELYDDFIFTDDRTPCGELVEE